MSYGNGTYNFVGKTGSGGGGGTITGAQNAASVVGTLIEHGGNPLLHGTSFDLNGFTYEIDDTGLPSLQLIPGVSSALASWLAGYGIALDIDVAGGLLAISDNFGQRLLINLISKVYEFGDIGGADNGTVFKIDDSNNDVSISDTLHGIYQLIDFFGQNIVNGDVNGLLNSYLSVLNIPNRRFQIFDVSGTYVDFFTGAGQYSIGDLSNLVSGMKIIINTTSDEFRVEGSLTAQRLLALSVLTGDYSIGDLDNIANGSRLEIHDTTQHFDFVTNAGGVIGTFRADGLQTTSPTGGITSHKAWQFGDHVAAVVAFDTSGYLEVNVNGTVYKLALAS